MKIKANLTDINNDTVPDYLYYSSMAGNNIFFKRNSITYVNSKIDGISSTMDTLHRIDMIFKDSNILPSVSDSNASSFYYNYYLPHRPQGVLNVKSYDKVVVHNLYEGIDVEYTSQPTHYDIKFILQPSIRYDSIKLQFVGADSIQIVNNELLIYTQFGSIKFPVPEAFQKNHVLSAFYQKSGSYITFNINDYSGSDTLFIKIGGNPVPLPTGPNW